MDCMTSPEPAPRARRPADPLVQLTGGPVIIGASDGADLHSVPDEPHDPRVDEDLLVVAAHLGRIEALLALPPGAARAVAATRYLAILEECRRDVIAVRDVSVRTMHSVGGLGGVRIAGVLGLNSSRGQQLIYRAEATHAGAAQHLAHLRERMEARRREPEH